MALFGDKPILKSAPAANTAVVKWRFHRSVF